MYHDVVEQESVDASGFPGGGPARYKLDWTLFDRHLGAIAAVGGKPASVVDFRDLGRRVTPWPLFLTFDDGGASAARIGDALTRMGWVGHFFIPVDYIGKPGFLDEAGTSRLAQMGHVIGTHSCSHPIPLSSLSEEQLLEEWGRSVNVLSEIIGSTVVSGSVPGGYCSRRVARTAALSGVKALFTSEPVRAVQQVEGCLLLGRYAILAGTPPELAVRLVRGELAPRFRQLASWRAKGVAKAVLGDSYRSLRTFLLDRS
ncbi:MAG TPA: polysaccharide deacetylase family protein [Gaiellaceae bacterium]|nr:polysaccharide deacetylase family protein [Gaiellaceae bacterium]